MSDPTISDEPSGLTVDGIRVPQRIEAAGGEAIEQYVLDRLTAPRRVAPVTAAVTAPARAGASVETAPNPPTFAEGAES